MPESEIEELVAQVPGWSVTEQQQIKRLERLFSFRNFADALDFTRRVGELAEAHGHHPRIVTEWGKVKVVWWTHKIRGLHLNDFMMAAKTDKLVG
jgi:4a-hydroxytetrahydrobiopterin dehydratase